MEQEIELKSHKEEKSLESLEKVYLKEKYPRNQDTDYNRLDIKVKDLEKISNLMAVQNNLNANNINNDNSTEEGYEFLKVEDPTMAQNYESFSLINGAKLENNEVFEEIKDEELVNLKYSTPLKKLKHKLVILKYVTLCLSFMILGYLSYHFINLLKMKLIYSADEAQMKHLNEYYQKNSDNLVFSNITVTIFVYFAGIVINTYNLLTHLKVIGKNIKFYENDYLINHNLQESCRKARMISVVFAIFFCVGNIFQIASFNYSIEFDSLANNNENNEGNDEDPHIMASWRVYFYVLVIAAILIKILLLFINVGLWQLIVKVKFEYSKMLFDLKNNIVV